MSLHIHLYDCNCIFCTSDFPIDFFQTHNSGGPDTQSMTVKQSEDETDPLDDHSDLDDDDEDDEDDSNDEDNDDEEDDEDEEECDEPKPQEKKKLFGSLIDSHNICVL